MPNPGEHIRQALIKRIRGIVEEHRTVGRGDDAQVACSCGAHGLSDHPGHVAEQIVDGLDLKVDAVDHIKKQIRYASAWFDWELTQLEGVEY
jgi:hypothetical protein